MALFAQLGTPTALSVRKYTNSRKIPQLFSIGGASAFGDYKNYPWSIGWAPNYQTEAHIYAKYILKARPDGKIAVLYQNDDFGKDYVKGLRDGLGDRADSMIVAAQSYETTDPTVDSQIVSLKASGADILFNGGTPKFGAQAIRKVYDLDWHPLMISGIVGNSVRSVMVPAGVEKSAGIISGTFIKDPSDPQWKDDPAMRDWLAWMEKYHPTGDRQEQFNVIGYLLGQTMEQVLRQCGDNLTRENIMRQATNLDMNLPLLLPGVHIKTVADQLLPDPPVPDGPFRRYPLGAVRRRHRRLTGTIDSERYSGCATEHASRGRHGHRSWPNLPGSVRDADDGEGWGGRNQGRAIERRLHAAARLAGRGCGAAVRNAERQQAQRNAQPEIAARP